MSGVVHIPPELFRTIAECVVGEHREQVLSTLCLTSQSFKAAAQPILFSQYIETSQEKQCRVGSLTHRRGDSISLSFVRFVQTVITRLQLASYVRIVHLKHCPRPPLLGPPERNPTAEDAKTFLRAARTFLETDEELIAKLMGFAPEELITLLLLRTTNLEDFRLDSGSPNVMLHYLRNAIHLEEGSSSQAFSRLKHINVGYGLAAYHIKHIAPILRLPTLQSLAVRFMWASELSVHAPDLLPRGSLSVSELDLADCDLDSDSLGVLLNACKCLKVFKYTQGSVENDLEGSVELFDPFNVEYLFRTLRSHEGWLEELYLRGLSDSGADLAELKLAGFPALRRVTVDQDLAAKFWLLAGSFQHLSLIDCDRDFSRLIRGLPVLVKVYLPHLQTLELRARNGSSFSEMCSLVLEEQEENDHDLLLSSLHVSAHTEFRRQGVKLEVSLTEGDVKSIKRGLLAYAEDLPDDVKRPT